MSAVISAVDDDYGLDRQVAHLGFQSAKRGFRRIQGAVDVGHGEEFIRVFSVDRSAVLHAHRLGDRRIGTPLFNGIDQRDAVQRAAVRERRVHAGEAARVRDPAAAADCFTWLARGEVDVVVGTRSAVFAPVTRLGLLIVDEEHDGSYKQEETPRYHGRDVAVYRAKLAHATCLLGSATPSLESYYNTKRGRYTLATLAQRVDNKKMPIIRIVDVLPAPLRPMMPTPAPSGTVKFTSRKA